METVVNMGKRDIECFRNAADCEPVYTLEEIMELKSTAKLKELARFVRVKCYTKMKREQLISGICERYSDSSVLTEILRGMDRQEWAFFKKAAEKRQCEFARVQFEEYAALQGMGLLQTFAQQERIVFVVPEEIRTVYKRLKKTDFITQKERSDLLRDYAMAAMHLYGFLSQDEFVAIFNSQNEQPTTMDEEFEALMQHVYMGDPYAFYDAYIVHDAFEENEYKDLLLWAEGIANKPRYIPERDEFLRYADWSYYEKTPQVLALQSFFVTEMKMSRRDSTEMIDDIHNLCEQEVKLQVIVDMLDERCVSFASTDELQTFVGLYTELHNHTRIWSNKGHTPDEMFRLYQPSSPRRVVKIGRNDPCPCGSGKKYKKCCGLLS